MLPDQVGERTTGPGAEVKENNRDNFPRTTSIGHLRMQCAACDKGKRMDNARWLAPKTTLISEDVVWCSFTKNVVWLGHGLKSKRGR